LLRIDHDYEPSSDRTDGNEAVFELRMLDVEDLEIVGAGKSMA
jgi:hypothetical protein